MNLNKITAIIITSIICCIACSKKAIKPELNAASPPTFAYDVYDAEGVIKMADKELWEATYQSANKDKIEVEVISGIFQMCGDVIDCLECDCPCAIIVTADKLIANNAGSNSSNNSHNSKNGTIIALKPDHPEAIKVSNIAITRGGNLTCSNQQGGTEIAFDRNN